MGVPKLCSFIERNVPHGTVPINIRNEIRKYYSAIATPNPPPPVIVVDIMCLVYPFCQLDPAGVICGGRFNEIYRCMNEFFGTLTSLGAKLEFFRDGPMEVVVPGAWCTRNEHKYQEMLKLFDAVDEGEDILSVMQKTRLPFLYASTATRAAMNHGRFHWATGKECDQEMAAFANDCKALAILSDDTDFLIHKGSWHLWCLKNLNFEKLTTVEWNRVQLARSLWLKPFQMPLLATLAGNDVVNVNDLQRFHCHLGKPYDKIRNVAKFIHYRRNKPVDAVFAEVLRFSHQNKDVMMSQFRESMAVYQVNGVSNAPQTTDPIEAKLLSLHIPLFYQMWRIKSMKCRPGVLDLRQRELGAQIPTLKLLLLLRMAGIILHPRQKDGHAEQCNVMIKLDHYTAHTQITYHAQTTFLNDLELPSFEELLSKDPITCSELQDKKLQLFCRIASNTLDPLRMAVVPKSLQTTVQTLYYLLEKRELRLFEADLILQVAHDVTFTKYDPQTVTYPRKLDSRPFRVPFVFMTVYEVMASGYCLVGLTDSNDDDPPFDGVLFHQRYDDWSRHLPGDDKHLSEIREWRIYESIAQVDQKDNGMPLDDCKTS